MTMSLEEFRTGFRDRAIELLWRQWTSLGVSGYGVPWRGGAVDPEALLLLTCRLGRYDARLFDAMIE